METTFFTEGRIGFLCGVLLGGMIGYCVALLAILTGRLSGLESKKGK